MCNMGCSTAEILLDFIEAIITAKHCASVFIDCWPLHSLHSMHRWRSVGTPLLGQAGNRLPVYTCKTDFSKGMTVRAFLSNRFDMRRLRVLLLLYSTDVHVYSDYCRS